MLLTRNGARPRRARRALLAAGLAVTAGILAPVPTQAAPTAQSQHVVFVGIDGRVHERWWSASTGWGDGVIQQVAGAPDAVGRPSGYTMADGTQHVVYTGTDQRIHELWWSAAGGWQHGVTHLVPGSPPGSYNGPTGYALADGTQHVVYLADDGLVHELWWSAATGWQHGNTHLVPGASQGYGTPSAYSLPDGTQHIVYTGYDSRIHELWWDVATGWHHGNTHLVAGAPSSYGGNPSGYTHPDGTQHVVYLGSDSRIHELWWNLAGGWHHGVLHGLSWLTYGNPTGYTHPDGTQHVVYRANDNLVHELWWSAPSGWHDGSLNTVPGAVPANGDPAAYVMADGTQHVVYTGVNGRVQELWWDPKGTWSVGTLSQAPGTPPGGDPAGYVL